MLIRRLEIKTAYMKRFSKGSNLISTDNNQYSNWAYCGYCYVLINNYDKMQISTLFVLYSFWPEATFGYC